MTCPVHPQYRTMGDGDGVVAPAHDPTRPVGLCGECVDSWHKSGEQQRLAGILDELLEQRREAGILGELIHDIADARLATCHRDFVERRRAEIRAEEQAK